VNTDRNLLFGVLALQADLLDAPRFAEACSAWAGRKDTPLADLLLERGWITPADRETVERLLELKLRQHGGDARASLAAVAGAAARQTLSTVDDAEVQQSLSGWTSEDTPLESTTAHAPGRRERYTLTACTPGAASARCGWPTTPTSAARSA
jgi:hypothetical protein